MRPRHWGVLSVENNPYFPPDSFWREYFRDSDHHTVCGWTGTASYYDVCRSVTR